MALRFRVEMTKKSPRISVLRVTANNTGQEKLELIGSFGQRKSPDSLRDKLTEDELYELENFLSTLEFSKEFFNCEAHDLDRFIIKVSPQFKEALYKLWDKAKKYDLEFIPEKEMLYSLLDKAKEIEKKINKLSGKKINVLESLGINIYEASNNIAPDIESKKLFQAMLGLNVPVTELCKEFQNIAQNIYHKNTRFEPHFFEHYADPNNKSAFPKWYYTVVIDLLHNHGINPLTIIAPHKVAKHWARLRASKLTIDKAKQLFIKTFNPPKNLEARCMEMISSVYLSYKV